MKLNRQGIAQICLVLSFALSFAGFFVLCDCPEFYVIAALFALVAVLCGARRLKLWGAAALAGALVILVSQITSNGSAKERAQKARELVRQKQEMLERVATNGLSQPDTRN